jgi:hypothetical protein
MASATVGRRRSRATGDWIWLGEDAGPATIAIIDDLEEVASVLVARKPRVNDWAKPAVADVVVH